MRSAYDLLQETLALPPSSGADAPGWYLPVMFTGMALAAVLIAYWLFRKR
jgi:hypothetical protein